MELDAKSDLYTGLALVVLAGAGLLWLVPAQIPVAEARLYDLSPRLVPRLLLLLMVLLGLVVMWHGWRARQAEAMSPGRMGTPRSPSAELGIDLAVWIASSVAVMASLAWLGFVWTAMPLLAVSLLLAGVRSPLLIALLTLILPITLEQLCWYALTIRLP